MDFEKVWDSSGNLEFVTDSSESNKKWSANGQLDFAQEWDSSGQLEFVVAGGTAPVVVTDIAGVSYTFAPTLTGIFANSIAITGASLLAAAQTQGAISLITDIVASCELSGVNGSHTLTLDINVDRDPKATVVTSGNNASYTPAQVSSKFADSPKLSCTQTAALMGAPKLQHSLAALQGDLPDLTAENTATLVNGIKLQAAIEHQRDSLADANNSIVLLHQDALTQAANPLFSGYKYPPRGDCAVANAWAMAEQLGAQVDTDFNDGVATKHHWQSGFEDAIVATGTRPLAPVIPDIVPPAVVPALDFLALWDNSGNLDFLRIELDALIVMNEIDIYHVASDGTKTAIHPVNASLDFDIDSFVWSFNGQLLGKDNLALLTHRANFEINVNGHQLLFTLREFSRVGGFANDAYSFTCVTNSQWLGQPYATLHNGTIEDPVGAWQLVADKFATEAFTLNRALTPEWTLQPDSFSYLNQSPIELALQVAQASGAILRPDKINDVIHVQPRYKTSPWDWEALTDGECDHVINADYVITESSNDNTTPQANCVLISGETHGVITEVVKAGTAGDVRAKDVLSPLSQDHNVNAELARNIMADSGEQEVLGLSIPLLPPDSDFGLLLPGEIIRVVYPDKTITGLCLSNSVPIQSITDVSQSVKLELNNGYS